MPNTPKSPKHCIFNHCTLSYLGHSWEKTQPFHPADAMDMLSSSERIDLQHTCNELQDDDPSREQLPSRVSPINH